MKQTAVPYIELDQPQMLYKAYPHVGTPVRVPWGEEDGIDTAKFKALAAANTTTPITTFTQPNFYTSVTVSIKNNTGVQATGNTSTYTIIGQDWNGIAQTDIVTFNQVADLTSVANGATVTKQTAKMFKPGSLVSVTPSAGQPTANWQHSVGLPEVGGVMAYRPAGASGVIRALWGIISDASLEGWPHLQHLELRVYTDIGADLPATDPGGGADWQGVPPAAKLTLQIPLDRLLGGVYDAVGPDKSAGKPPRQIHRWGANFASGGGTTFTFSFPIPFADGVCAVIWDTNTNAAILDGMFQGHHVEDGPLPNWQYSNWRLRSALYAGQLDTAGEATLMDVSDKGMIVAICEAMGRADSGDNAPVVCNHNFYLDGSTTPNYVLTGLEDWGLDTFIWASSLTLGNIQEDLWGVWNTGNGDFEIYRIFEDDPIMFKSGCRVVWVNDASPAINNVDLETLILFYGPTASA